MRNNKHIIKSVAEGSIAEELEIEAGDEVVSINGKEIADILDYHFLSDDTDITLLIRKPDGEEWEMDIEKDEDEDLGIEFENGLMDDYKSCCNKCIFCFIDQMPKGMRDTLYFKDDDSRLSFLQGNYVTLTNMKDADIQRIIDYRMEPINISVHTTEPELRKMMLGNRFAGDALRHIRPLYEAGIRMNGQIVLCKGINDGEHLRRTISDLSEYLPYMQSLSVVPVGLTKFRDDLYPLEPFTKEDAKIVLGIIHEAQEKCFEKWENHFVHAGDEWYLLADEPVPEEDNYDGYPQLENGVGMVRMLRDEFHDALRESAEVGNREDGISYGDTAEQGAGAEEEINSRKKAEEIADHDLIQREISIVCGKLIEPEIRRLLEEFNKEYPKIKVHVYAIRNDFFGERITVSGLITGQDIIAQLKGKPLGSRLLMPSNMLRYGEDVLLDDVHICDIEAALGVKTEVLGQGGDELLAALLGDSFDPESYSESQPYEIR